MTRLTHIHNPLAVLTVQSLFLTALCLAEPPTAQSSFSVTLPPHHFADDLLPASPFGINTAFQPDTPDLEAILQKMQQAGIKWGRQDFTWRRIEKSKGQYQFEDYDRLVDTCRKYGLLRRHLGQKGSRSCPLRLF